MTLELTAKDMKLTWFLFLIPRKLSLFTNKRVPYENLISGSGYTVKERPLIKMKAGFGVTAVTLQILSNGYLVNQTITEIRPKTVLKVYRKIEGGMIFHVQSYNLPFAKGKKVICVPSSIVIK